MSKIHINRYFSSNSGETEPDIEDQNRKTKIRPSKREEEELRRQDMAFRLALAKSGRVK